MQPKHLLSAAAALLLAGACADAPGDTDLQAPASLAITSAEDRTSLAVNEALRLAVKGLSSDGRELPVTNALWRSEDTARAVVDADGEVRGVVGGEVRISVTAGGLSQSLALTVRGAFHRGEVGADETWRASDNPHRVLEQGVEFAGAQLVIEAGVEVFFERDTRLLIGEAARLEVRGTAPAPVRFSSAAAIPARGDYGGLVVIEDGRATIDHLLVEYAGGESRTGDDGAIQVRGEDNRPVLRHVTVREGGSVGLALLFGAEFAPESADLTLKGNDTYALAFDHADSVASAIPTIAFEGNTHDAVVIYRGAVTRSQTWVDLGVPYVVPTQMIEIEKETQEAPRPVLTIAAGVTIRFGPQAGFHAGENLGGELRLLGTESAPILLTADAASPAPGGWPGLVFDAFSTGSRVEWTTVAFAGATTPTNHSDAAVIVRDDAKKGFIRHSTLRGSAGAGVTQVCVEIDPLACSYTDFAAPLLGNTFADLAGPVQIDE